MASHSGYSIRDFGRMVEDQRRTEPYVRALERAIGPDSVFVDIGTGTGFFAFLACKLGARRVYAIEPDHAIEIAKLCAIDNIAKGASGGAVQAANVALGLPEAAGLSAIGMYP